MQWHEQVNTLPAATWLILHITALPAKAKPMRLKLREDVYDRLRSDFGAKGSADRCLQLPTEDAAISAELRAALTHAFTNRLRAALISQVEHRYPRLHLSSACTRSLAFTTTHFSTKTMHTPQSHAHTHSHHTFALQAGAAARGSESCVIPA